MKKKASKRWVVLTAVTAVLLAVCIVAIPVTNAFSSVISVALNAKTQEVIPDPEATVHFTSNYDNEEDLVAFEKELCESIEAEGAALLLNNDNTLPLAEGTKFTTFSQSSYNLMYGGTGSGQVSAEDAVTLKEALPTVGGVEIFVRTEAWERAFPQTGDLPQWTYEGYVPLSQEAADLYGAAIPFLRAELEEWSREGSGSLDTAVHQEYQIVSAGEPVPNPSAGHPENSGLEFWVETPEGESSSFWVILDGAGRPVALHPAGDAGLTVE